MNYETRKYELKKDEWLTRLTKRLYEQDAKIKILEEDVAFAKRAIFSLLGDRTLVMKKDQPTPTDLDFDLSENEDGEILVRIHTKKVRVNLNDKIDLEFDAEVR